MRTGRVVAPVVLLLSLSSVQAARAQPGPERLEMAVNLSLLHVSDFGSTNAGIGGRMTFNLTKHVALEGDVEYTPNDRIRGPEERIEGLKFQMYDDRSRTTGLFGVKVGTYTPRFGVFGKARPGFTHLTAKGGGCLGDGCLPMYARTTFLAIPPKYVYSTEFAFDVGGGFEVYPTGRTVARVEVGDTIIRNQSVTPPCYTDCTSHNVASRVGFGWRF